MQAEIEPRFGDKDSEKEDSKAAASKEAGSSNPRRVSYINL